MKTAFQKNCLLAQAIRIVFSVVYHPTQEIHNNNKRRYLYTQ